MLQGPFHYYDMVVVAVAVAAFDVEEQVQLVDVVDVMMVDKVDDAEYGFQDESDVVL